MAGPAQKKPEETEAVQMKQLATLAQDFHKAQYAYVRGLEKIDTDPSYGKSKEFAAAKKAYDVEFRKMTDFALGHVKFLRRMLEVSLAEGHVNLDGKHLGLAERDQKALQVIDGIKGTEYFVSGELIKSSGSLWHDPSHVVLSTKTRTGTAELFYFYYGGKEASEKTGNVAFYPSNWVYAQVDGGRLNLVPKKNQ
jgi:hypothetical protein